MYGKILVNSRTQFNTKNIKILIILKSNLG